MVSMTPLSSKAMTAGPPVVKLSGMAGPDAATFAGRNPATALRPTTSAVVFKNERRPVLIFSITQLLLRAVPSSQDERFAQGRAYDCRGGVYDSTLVRFRDSYHHLIILNRLIYNKLLQWLECQHRGEKSLNRFKPQTSLAELEFLAPTSMAIDAKERDRLYQGWKEL